MGATAQIGYENLLEDATLTASSEDTGFEVENLADWRLDDAWKPTTAGTHNADADLGSAQSVDYFACFGHNLADVSGTVKLQHATSGAGPWTDAFTAITPTENRVIFKTFTSQSKQYWRIVTTSTGSPAFISVASIGAILDLQRGMRAGFIIPGIFQQVESMNAITHNGNFIGKSVKQRPQRVNISQTIVTPTWVRSNLETMVDHINSKPFFFAHDLTNYPDESAFCWTTQQIRPPTNADNKYWQFTINAQGMSKTL